MNTIYMFGSCVKGKDSYLVYAVSRDSDIELFLADNKGTIVSAYKTEGLDEYAYSTSAAKEIWGLVKLGLKKCSNKRMVAAPVAGLGTVKRYEATRGNSTWYIDKYRNQFCGCECVGFIKDENVKLYLSYSKPYDLVQPAYIKLTNYISYNDKKVTDVEFDTSRHFEETIPVRSLAEISLEKDTTWLNNKKYYIVNDENDAEQIFQFLENYNGIISYDTETTGLCINMFGEIGSERKKHIEAENERLIAEGKAPYKVDRLVGIIFCVEENVSYYFPCFNRKFKNLYQDRDDELTKKTIERIKARYIVGELREANTNIANYIRNTPDSEWTCDVILMERVRKILETRWLGTHHGSFEYKVGLMYNIDTNIKDDSMLLHQLLYKFRNITSSNDRGEPSNLKYLTKVEFGVDQLDLKDFFVDYSEDASGLAKQSGKKGKKKKSHIDFSYMDYEGSKAYAPADGDFTLGLILKYKKGLLTEFKNQEYLYTVEIIVSCAIGYMEYYGHRLDERQIEATKIKTYTSMLLTERKIRDLIHANTEEEQKAFDLMVQFMDDFSKFKIGDEGYDDALTKLDNQNMLVRKMLDESENQLNLGSPAQVAELFYDRMGIPIGKDGTRSVSKRAVKPLAKAKNEDLSLKYPVVKYYMDWKNDSTLLTKFFDNLPNYMYPGGFIFSGYGQITTATGRMSCICEGTQISVPGGYKKIEDLNVGDYVYCYDDYDILRLSRLMNRIDKSYEDCVKIKWHKLGELEYDYLILTPDHRVKTSEGDWVEAKDLVPGDNLINLRRGVGVSEQDFVERAITDCSGRLGNVYTDGLIDYTTYYVVNSVEPAGVHHVYDLQVEGYHNFIANGVEVKNCSKPNAQQYPHSVTCMVIPREGCVFADADYSQIEYRTMTAMAKEKSLMDRFADPDMDYHTTMASLMFGVPYANVTGSMRSDAKTFNFGIPYGMGIKKLAFQLRGSEDAAAVEEAKIKYELYFKEQPNVRKFFENVKEAARVYGYTETKWGRRRYYSFTDENGRIDQRKLGASLRQAGNCVIQGCLCGTTLIATKKYGINKIKNLEGLNRIDIWNGEKWTKGDVVYSGKKQKCIVRFSNGQEFICSPLHKFLVISHKGNKRWVECKDLVSREMNKSNPYRVSINLEYEKADWRYSSDWAYQYSGKVHNAHNHFLSDIGDSFKIGVFLGRLASDGSYDVRPNGGSNIVQLVAEHEFNILPELRDCMEKLGYIEKDNPVRKDRNEKINHLAVYSKALASEIRDLDIKHQVHENIFMDTELLRGFLRGFFDGYGGVSGDTINLTFGTQYEFESMCRDIQKALLFFGVRARYHKYDDRYRVAIDKYDIQRFLDNIGFMNEDKQSKARTLVCGRDQHIFGPCLVVESVKITDEYIDMYDVCNTEDGYYVADGIITHNTAADIFKIGVARNFMFLRENNLFGKYFITNMVHDEQLVEISCDLNVQAILARLIHAMELHIEGFPPLYVGAGIGHTWDEAKGKMAEIHPLLGREFVKEYQESNMGIWATDETRMTPDEVYAYFINRNYKFREKKVLDYVLDESNYGKVLHPVIGALLGLQFDYGVKKDLKEKYPDGMEGISYTKEEKEVAERNSPLERLRRFIEAHNLDISIDNFKPVEAQEAAVEEVEEDKGYTDGEEEDDSDLYEEEDDAAVSSFKLLDESNTEFGCSLEELTKQFGVFISKKNRLLCINYAGLTAESQLNISKYLGKHICDVENKGALRLQLLNKAGKLRPRQDEDQMYVRGITEDEILGYIHLRD